MVKRNWQDGEQGPPPAQPEPGPEMQEEIVIYRIPGTPNRKRRWSCFALLLMLVGGCVIWAIARREPQRAPVDAAELKSFRQSFLIPLPETARDLRLFVLYDSVDAALWHRFTVDSTDASAIQSSMDLSGYERNNDYNIVGLGPADGYDAAAWHLPRDH